MVIRRTQNLVGQVRRDGLSWATMALNRARGEEGVTQPQGVGLEQHRNGWCV
ncbi:unnamed protein product, partial [Ectocarpus sp. 13 AM-2016]